MRCLPHYDGFCLFDSRYTDFKSTNTPSMRHCRSIWHSGMKGSGRAFIIRFWTGIIPIIPTIGFRTSMRNRVQDAVHNFDNYLDYMHSQVEELCTNYGKIDVLWFDYSYDDVCGAEWRLLVAWCVHTSRM